MALDVMGSTEDLHTRWAEFVGDSYRSYLRTSFYFRDNGLRQSFDEALQAEGALVKGPFAEGAYDFKKGVCDGSRR